MDLHALIKDLPLVEHLTEAEKDHLAGMEHALVRFGSGDTVISEGDESRCLFLLLKGSCLVTKTINGANIRLAKLKSGEIFGEMACLAKRKRQSNVIASEDVLVLKMDDAFFEKLTPGIVAKIKDYMMDLLIMRLDKMNDAIMRISTLMRT